MSAAIVPFSPVARAAVSPQDLQPATLIVTTEPRDFEVRFADRLGVDVFVVSSPSEALRLMPLHHWVDVYADFRQLEGLHRGVHWNGTSLLREIRANPTWKVGRYFVMANEWHAHQRDWLEGRMGVAGLLKRSAAEVASLMQTVPPSGDEVVKPIRRDQVVPATQQPHSAGGPSPIKPPSPPRAPQKSHQEVPAIDPAWRDAVFKVFTQFAGALGAQIICADIEDSEVQGARLDSKQYVKRLATSLTRQESTTAFLGSLKRAGLGNFDKA